MDVLRRRLRDIIATVSEENLSYNDFSPLYESINEAEVSVLILAADYQNERHLMPLYERALERDIPIIFYQTGQQLLEATRADDDRVDFLGLLRYYNVDFIDVVRQIKNMDVRQLIPPHWNPALHESFAEAYGRHRIWGY